MNFKEIQKMAKRYKIKTEKKNKVELIREIQRAEGNFDCFGTAGDYCDQTECLFRELCLAPAK